jgi:hypothetical protein
MIAKAKKAQYFSDKLQKLLEKNTGVEPCEKLRCFFVYLFYENVLVV